jgi:small-conductance mechanosensitive channel
VYEALALRYLRILLAVLVVGVFMGLWHLDPSTWIADFLGERVAAALFDISVTVFLAYIAWGVAKAAIESHAGPEPTESGPAHGGGDGGGMGGTRVETLLPLVRKFLWVTLVTIVVMVSLSSLGVNIGPLLAGAGMVGIAIGFGAQTLVRDIVSGFFFLLDDAFRIGEYVEIDADTRGTVEKISVRSFQLRHHKGPVHTVPFGEIRSLTNYSRDWAIMKFELRLPFETNIEKVRKIIKGIGQEMQDDPDIGPQLLEPLKSQGVNRMDDSALIIRCKFTAIPGEQFVIRREAFTRIQRAFEEEGIHFAPRRVLVEATTPAAAVAGAAAAIDQETKPQSSSDDRG